jgi:hypothetical protein
MSEKLEQNEVSESREKGLAQANSSAPTGSPLSGNPNSGVASVDEHASKPNVMGFGEEASLSHD